VLVLLVTAIAGLFGGRVQATCGSSYCYLETGTREGLVIKGSFLVDLSYEFVDQTGMRAGSNRVDEVLTPKINFEDQQIEPDHHREISTLNTLLRLNLTYGVGSRLSVFVHLPLINDRAHEHYDDAGTPEEFFTNQDGSSGFGDVRVGVRYGFLVKARDLITGDLALKLPTGPYKERDSEGNINEPTIQPGRGSWDAIGRLNWTRQISTGHLETFLSGSYRLNQENDLDYRFGDEVVLTAGVRQQSSVRWSWTVQLNGRLTGRDRYLDQDVPSTGAEFVSVGPGLRFTSSQGTMLYGFVQVPVYQYVNEAQLVPRYGLLLGISKSF